MISPKIALYQDLTYNANDRSIRFRDIDIEVDYANNSSISFSVKKAP